MVNKARDRFRTQIKFLLDLAKDISDACTLNVTDVEAVLTSLVRKLPVYLKSGFKIQFGTFGRVKMSFSSKGSVDPKTVDASSITDKRIIFTPSQEIKNEIEKTSFTKISLAGDVDVTGRQ